MRPGGSWPVRAGTQSEKGKESFPASIADAGSIEEHGINLAAILAAGIAEVIGSSCYDSLQVEGCSAPFRTGLRRL